MKYILYYITFLKRCADNLMQYNNGDIVVVAILNYLGFDSARSWDAEFQDAPSRNNPRKKAPFRGPSVFAFSHSPAFKTRKLNSA